jgi:hypothetical protein
VQAAKDSSGKDKDGLYMKNGAQTPRANGAPPKATPAPVFSPPQSASGADHPGLGLPSASYEELMNKYCFVRIPGVHFNLPEHPATRSARPGTGPKQPPDNNVEEALADC